MARVMGLGVIVALLTAGLAAAAELRTADGLAVRLSDRTGEHERISISGQAVKLIPGGGLSYREFSRDATAPARVVWRLNAEAEQPTWLPASFADWETGGDVARRHLGDAPEGQAYLELGNGKDAGVGLAMERPVAVSPGGECTVTWLARTHQTDLTYILCLRVFDAKGRDITADVPAPPGWAWSPYSKAHYRADLANTKPDMWERLSSDYMINENVVAARLSVRVYTGGNLRADIDDLQVAVKAGHWSAETTVTGPVTSTPAGLQQLAVAPQAGLRFQTRLAAEAGQIRATVEVLATDQRPRCLRVRYRLPLALAGWTWSGDPCREETIGREGRCEHSFGLAGHPVSVYPIASVSHGPMALAMAVPLDQPALQTFYAASDGLSTVVDFGLSPQAPRARGQFAFSLYRHDPAWTFRAALERYYELFPQFFAPATGRGGAWTLRLPRPEHASPEAFGLAFYECNTLTAEQQVFCRTHRVLMLPYAEPWGRRQDLGQAESSAELPPYEQRLAFLKYLAESTEPGKKWGEAPRAEMAQAVLNSLIAAPDGKAAFYVDRYSSWAQWWQLNTDPDLPPPSMASVSRQYEIDPLLAWADGIYLDSVSPAFGHFEDHNPAHLAAADLPLGFSLRRGQPVVLSAFAHYEFIARLFRDLHRQGKVLMMNLFPPATRLYGHMGDVVGSELLDLQDDAEAMQQRVYAGWRPVSNLMQWKSAVLLRVPAMTADEMEAYLANQLLYGFWPGLSTAGGGTEPGYAHMHRYFEDAKLLQRDRPLFAAMLPAFDALNAAGWAPVTHVRSSIPSVRVERYGQGTGTMLAVANTSTLAQTAVLTFDRDWWKKAINGERGIVLESMLTRDTISTSARQPECTCQVTIPARRTLVLRVADNRAQPTRGDAP